MTAGRQAPMLIYQAAGIPGPKGPPSACECRPLVEELKRIIVENFRLLTDRIETLEQTVHLASSAVFEGEGYRQTLDHWKQTTTQCREGNENAEPFHGENENSSHHSENEKIELVESSLASPP